MENDSKSYLWRDAQRVLLFPLLVAGVGMGSYGGHVFNERINAEIQARKIIHIQIRKDLDRLERLFEKHQDKGFHPSASREISALKSTLKSIKKP